MALQDVIALVLAAAAAAWLARGFLRRLGRPGCGGTASPPPAGADGFVPIDRLAPHGNTAKKAGGDP